MRVLISCKTTNLDVHGESIRRKISGGLLDKSHLERLRVDHAQHHQALEVLLKELHRHRIEFVEVGRGMYWPDLRQVDAIVTVGGDGTVLEASHHIVEAGIPVLGVCSSSMSVGFLCAGNQSSIPALVKDLAENRYESRLIQRLQARVEFTTTGGEQVTGPVLNDFLYANQSPAATTRYRIDLGGESEVHKSSGIWLSTPAGSTAAIAAAGGRQVPMDTMDFQFLVREPYTPPQSPPFKICGGFFDPDKAALVVENHCDQAVLALDGQRGSIPLSFGDKMTFTRARPLKLVTC